MSVVIELPGEPRGKARPRFSRKSGRAYTPTETQNYEAMLRTKGAEAMQGRDPMQGALVAYVDAFFAIPMSWSLKKQQQAAFGEIRPTKRPDADNVCKMLDSINGIVCVDDSQIVECVIRKWYSHKPRLRIEIGEL